jgi:hypothetical protein
MLKQLKKALGILLIAFLMSLTVAAVSAETGNSKEIAMKKVVAGKKVAMKIEDGKDLTNFMDS